MAKRLALLALLAAGMLVAVPGPHDLAQAAFPGSNGRIAFVRYPGGGILEEIFLVNPGVALSINLTKRPMTSDVAPAWSPDGSQVVFARGGDQDDGMPINLFTVAPSGGATTQVTFGAVVDLMPSWQPL